MNPQEIPVRVVAPDLIPPPLPAVPTSSDAKKTGVKVSFLATLFAALSYTALSLGQWFLANQSDINLGKYESQKQLLTVLVTIILLGIDRYKHENPNDPSTGLIKV